MRGSHFRKGFGAIELLASIAFLVVFLGMMLSLSRYVRADASDRTTRRVLRQMRDLLDQYVQTYHAIPPAAAFDNSKALREETLPDAMADNNGRLVRSLLHVTVGDITDQSTQLLSSGTVRDAWGSPLGYMTTMHHQVGMSSGNSPFLFSAGPDRKYLTRDDNLYSYEVAEPVRNPTSQPARSPRKTGHRE